MIYTDKVHIVSDSIKELHSFARNIGIHYCWFHNHKKHPHYDFPKVRSRNNSREKLIQNALLNGAILKTSKELVEIINKW